MALDVTLAVLALALLSAMVLLDHMDGYEISYSRKVCGRGEGAEQVEGSWGGKGES